jgi:cyclopropane fatty-acyl-phospholipid synthase-like methyltransferase
MLAIKSIFNRPLIYQIFQYVVGYDRAIKAIIRDYIRPYEGMKVLDIGCGTGFILDYLPKQIDYTGIDYSAEYISYARKKYGGKGMFIQGDVSDVAQTPIGQFNEIIAIGLLHHLPDDKADDVLSLVHKNLLPDGRFITVDPCYNEGQSSIARFIISQDRGTHVRKEEEYRDIAMKRFNSVDFLIINTLLRIPYTHCILSCTDKRVS